MSYQVLARKWRPRVFHEMAGQEHVLQALINALDNNRLHHAYLFTGTRGVGKTTIARILAKCLNCEQGIGSRPCGECGACLEINDGRFVDLIEVDAASRTKVEDTRELLENVQYAPTRGRYKVYLIDEVHMLSAHSFNALLKTLEEPPPHIKFLLATTDPQKLPVTILSRCLQFNLKNLSPERISEHLAYVLGEEQVPAEEAGIWALARAADGSMRDALSLTDQAIAHGGGKVTEVDVNVMLGAIDRSWVTELCQAIAASDAQAALAVVEKMAEHAPDYHAVLGDVLAFWHRVAIAQTVPDALDNRHGDYQQVMALAKVVAREDVQLFYQIGLLGRRDLPMAADPRSGFEMVLLRQIAFKPGSSDMRPRADIGTATSGEGPAAKKSQTAPVEPPAPALPESGAMVEAPVAKPEFDPTPPAVVALPETRVTQVDVSAPDPDARIPTFNIGVDSVSPIIEQRLTDNPSEDPMLSGGSVDIAASQPRSSPDDVPEDSWISLYHQLEVPGVLGNTAANLVLLSREPHTLRFRLDEEQSSLYDVAQQERLAAVLSEHFGREIAVEIEIGTVAEETPRMWDERKRAERQTAAVASLRNDPLVQDLIGRFGGRLLEETVVPSGL